ncbi:MAG: Gfo/Idh/MocA family oxidoreductase [Deltaproteobacteria bacterium]|nr:Gfo/Idh/MocA family oxidoreductase [Deltaproteobacteria bacterium]
MRLGFIGTGTAAQEHAKVALALGHRIVAASARSESSPRWERFHSLAPTARFIADVDSLLKAQDVDAIVVSLNWNVTHEWLEALVTSPKPMLIEKPPALDQERLKSALHRHPATVANKRVAYNRRLYEPVQILRARVKEGGLKSVEVTLSDDIEHYRSRYGEEIIPHLTMFAGTHLLDLMIFLFSPLRLLKSYPYPEKGEAKPYVSFHALLESGAGVPLWLSLNADDPSPVGIRCRFDDGTTWHLAPLERLKVYRGFQIEPPTKENNIRSYTPKPEKEVAVDNRFVFWHRWRRF